LEFICDLEFVICDFLYVMLKKWNVFSEDKELQKKFADELNISPITAQVLINRNIVSLQQAHFFYKANLCDLHNPFLLRGMDIAVQRIKKAIAEREKIIVYGDYDADGITATALLSSLLSKLGADVRCYIPNRLSEGYGLNKEALNKAASQEVSLLITVDCGINAVEEVRYAAQLGIDIIITDHHRLGEELPSAFAVINPLQTDCPYPDKNLAGVGLAYKLASALTDEKGEEYLDLVALGTVADVVPLVGENRVLVKEGLKKIGKGRIGLSALAKVAGLKREINAASIAYILGPRINARGRLSSPQSALKLLLTSSWPEAENLARVLNDENARRQKVEKEILEQALKKLSDIDVEERKIIILSDERWHPGVIGIVASRLVEKYYRPVILIAIKERKAKGSGRSIKNFHLFDALLQCKDILDECGGHKYAVGLSLQVEKIEEFKQRMEEITDNLLSREDLIPCLNIDARLSLSQLDFKFLDELTNLAPFGVGNPKPVFASKVRLKSFQRLKNNHLKIWVSDDKITYPALWFNQEGDFSPPAGEFQIAYSPTVNIWEGRKEIQLVIKDVKSNLEFRDILG